MQNYKMILSYDGTNFQGWQSQKSTENTIQGKLEKLLSEYARAEVEVNGAGRTDAGVHAECQCASFKLPLAQDPEEIKAYLNSRLPESVFVKSVETADMRFHARLNARGKTYLYRIFPDGKRDVFLRKFSYIYDKTPDIEKMRSAAKLLTGTHDFTGFCAKAPKNKSAIRTVSAIDITETAAGAVEIRCTGDGFLYNQVRIMTGTLLEIGVGTKTTEDVKKALELKDRQYAGFTAPAQGLTLECVYYG